MRIIAGEARGRTFDAPAGLHTRPTLDRVRENIFNMIQTDVPESRVLDLFAGSGALSLEAVSRGAVNAVMVDSDRRACDTQKRNIEKLRYSDRIRVMHCDWRKALDILRNENMLFDLVFLDPPYAMLDLREVFSGLIPVIHRESHVVLEYESDKKVAVSDKFMRLKDRSWGFCAVSVYRQTAQGE